MDRNDFDPDIIQGMLRRESLTHQDAYRLLGEACHVIHGLREDHCAVSRNVKALAESVDAYQHWMNKKEG